MINNPKVDEILENTNRIVDEKLEDTTKIIKDVKKEIEETIIDYKFLPGKNIIETDENIIVKIELPGIKKEDIDIKLTENKLFVKAEITTELGKSKYITKAEQKNKIVKRTVRFPKKVLPEEANAKLEDGILTVIVTKLEQKETFKVDIN
ncbi:MAG: Hsp20/alpha crystallin family protein [Methanobacteriaceae archaeon]|nr:Hsp20/alpha crystallin family protein [Methanobacteriaceae archaeon]